MFAFVSAPAETLSDAVRRRHSVPQLLSPLSRGWVTRSFTNSARLPLGSVDGHALPIDELKGTKPTEKIDLSSKGLGVESAIIIASCIKGNGVLKQLKCAAVPYRVCFCVSAR